MKLTGYSSDDGNEGWKNPNRRRPIGKKVIARVKKRDNYKCVKCGSTENLTIDHIIAVYNGGTNKIGNLQTMCAKCNEQKGNN